MNQKGIIVRFSLLIAVVVLAFFGYRFFFGSTEAEVPSGLVGLSPAGVMTEASTDEFVTLLASLQAINLNDLPRVLALLGGLQDFSTDLEPQEPGRANPFAPIGQGGTPTIETVATTTPSTGSGQAATSTRN